MSDLFERPILSDDSKAEPLKLVGADVAIAHDREALQTPAWRADSNDVEVGRRNLEIHNAHSLGAHVFGASNLASQTFHLFGEVFDPYRF